MSVPFEAEFLEKIEKGAFSPDELEKILKSKPYLVNCKNKKEETPLILVVKRDLENLAKVLVKNGAKISSKEVDVALKYNSKKSLDILINHMSHKKMKKKLATRSVLSKIKKANAPISIGQALLILIKHCQFKKDEARVKELKRLYLSGSENKLDREMIMQYLKDDILKTYIISGASEVIDNDPSRRYFETHLAFETQKAVSQSFQVKELKEYYETLYHLLPDHMQKAIEPALKGEHIEDPDYPNITFVELSDCIKRIESEEHYQYLLATKEEQSKMTDSQRKDMQASLKDEKEKIKFLIKSIFLGVVIAWNSKEANPNSNYTLPLALYGKGPYEENYRGKRLVQSLKEKGEKEKFQSKHLGLMKQKMPVPQFDVVFAKDSFAFVKPSDQAYFLEGAGWVQYNFSKLVHPFSNSISGTMLCQIRALAFLEQNDMFLKNFKNKDKFVKLIQGLISPLLYLTGGHTLYEFTTPFVLDEVRRQFSFIPEYYKVNLNTLFLEGNEKAFDKALKDTIIYNTILLQRRKVQQELFDASKDKEKFPLEEAIQASKAYLGELETLGDIKKIPVDKSSLVKQGGHYFLVFKNKDDGLDFYVLESSHHRFKINGQEIALPEKDFETFIKLFPVMMQKALQAGVKEQKERKEKNEKSKTQVLTAFEKAADKKTNKEDKDMQPKDKPAPTKGFPS